MSGLTSGTAGPLRGDVHIPGDKSISHRALMIGAMAVGETTISGLLESGDVLRTAAALRALGVPVERDSEGGWRVHGVGPGGLAEPAEVLDLGNSGTSARLLIGLLATHPLTAHMTGDGSLRERPMGRVAEPVERMGARVIARAGGRMPLAVIGTPAPVPITYSLPVPSAQIKSAVLLAGLNTPGTTSVIETRPSRDHTELMLRHFGADIEVSDGPDGGRTIALDGQPELSGRPVTVPGDPSSAAFPGVAALLVPGSEVTVRNVGLNPTRTGLFETLLEMGADIGYADRRSEAGEAVADLTFRASALNGVDVPAERAPTMIDEYPILAVAASFARGETRMHGLGELRVKESDRLAAIAGGLAACGVRVSQHGDSLTVEGTGRPPDGGARIAAKLDHRIAMAFAVLGMAAGSPVETDGREVIATSFPGFTELMNGLGATMETLDGSS